MIRTKLSQTINNWNLPTSNWWNFYAGVVLVGGTTLLYPIADIALLGMVLWGGFRLNPWALSIGLLVAVTGLWGSDIDSAGWFLLRCAFIASIVARVRICNSLWYGMGSIALVIFGVSFYQLVSGDITFGYRPYGIHMNSSALGLSGLALASTPLGLLGGAITGMSVSRTYLAAMAIWGFVVSRNPVGVLIVFVACCVAVFSILVIGDERRFSSAGIKQDMELRNSLNEVGVEVDTGGLGYRSFVLDTGSQRPHNIYILSWYEMGWLSIVLWGVVGVAIIKYKFVWSIPLLFAGLLTDELFARPEGLYSIAVIGVGTVWGVADTRNLLYIGTYKVKRLVKGLHNDNRHRREA